MRAHAYDYEYKKPQYHAVLAMPPEAGQAVGRQLPKERPHLTRCTRLLCSAFLSVLLLVGVLLFVLYLAVRPHRPRFHVTAFSVARITAGGPFVLSGQLSIRNPNQDVAFYFDRLYVSVDYRDGLVVKDRDVTGRPMFQPPKSTTTVGFEGAVGSVDAVAEMSREARDTEGGSVRFTVKVRSRIRVRVSVLGSHWHPLHVSCDVAVGPDGLLLAEYREKRCDIYFF